MNENRPERVPIRKKSGNRLEHEPSEKKIENRLPFRFMPARNQTSNQTVNADGAKEERRAIEKGIPKKLIDPKHLPVEMLRAGFD